MYADWTDRIADGRAAVGDARASAGPRAQRRRHDVGLGGSEGLSARRDRERQAQSDRQRERADLRRARRERRLPAGRRSEDATRRARSSSTVRDPKTPSSAEQPPAAPSPYWGDEAIWNSQTTVHSFAMDKQARVSGPRRASASRRRRRGARRDRIIRRRSCSRSSRASAAWSMYDPKTKQTTTIDTCFTWGHLNFDDNDVLWSSFGPAGVEGWFDTKIWDKTHDEKTVAGLERVRPRQQRQRQARRLHRAESAGRSDEGQADQRASSTATRRRRTDRSGDRCRACPARSCASSRDRIRRRRRWPSSTKCRGTIRRRRCRASRRAAWTSTARASSGRCSRADISPASIAASARAR